MITRKAAVRTVLATGVMLLAGCHDPCLLVAGCRESLRVAVEGRVVSATGRPRPGTAVTLLVASPGGVDSARVISDDDGLFSLVVPLTDESERAIALRVRPVAGSGYVISPLDCGPVRRWGDACVLPPILAEPEVSRFRFVHRHDVSRGIARARVVFTRTGGARLTGPRVTDSVSVVTDSAGFVTMFSRGVFPDSGAVSGTLRVELPQPVGTTIRDNYPIRLNAGFNVAAVTVQPVGPNLEYLMVFADSATGKRVSGVEMRFRRQSGIPTATDTARFVSNADGLAFLTLIPLDQGSVTGDFSLVPPGAQEVTTLSGVTLNTFEADSSIVFARWKVGATGRLYPMAPP